MAASTSDKSKSWIEQEISFKCGSNELFGILTVPTIKDPYPVVVLLHGSDRKGVDSPRYVNCSHNLVQSGFAILRYDSPGVGRSSGSVIGETLEYRTQEAVSAVKYLKSREDILSDGVGLWGISQGGWICQMAAATYDGVAFIIPVSGPGVNPAEQEIYRVEMQSKGAGFSEDEVDKAVLFRRLLVDLLLSKPMYKTVNEIESNRLGEEPWERMMELIYARKSDDTDAFLKRFIEILHSVKDEVWSKYLYIGEFLKVLDGLPSEKWDEIKTSYETVMKTDPADYLTKVQCPVLAIFGEADKVVPVTKSVSLYERYLKKAGNMNVTIKVFPKANHQIHVDGEPAPGYYETLIEWLSNLHLK